MEKFEEIKIKVVMKAEKVSRDRAQKIIAERCRKTVKGDPVKAGGSIAPETDEMEWMDAEDFFSGD